MGPKLGERMSIFYFYGTESGSYRSWAFALSIFKVVVLILIGA